MARPLVLLPLVALLACSPAAPGGPDAGVAPPVPLPEVDFSTWEDGRDWRYSEARERCAARAETRQVLFGDLHSHTAFSWDAWAYGNRALPGDAYRFAKGEAIAPLADGRVFKLSRPLDFAAVSDHVEFLGEMELCTVPGSPGYEEGICTRLRDDPETGVTQWGLHCANPNPTRWALCSGGSECIPPARERRWEALREAAEAHDDKTAACRFSAFVAYEYTRTPSVNNLHRLVLFRNAKVPAVPASGYEAPTAWHLWASLLEDCHLAGTGCDAMTLAHNTNLSSGAMFAPEPAPGLSVAERAYRARVRRHLEPLLEVFQHKGASECREGIGATSGDPLCAFEQQWPADAKDCGEGIGTLGMRLVGCTSRFDYARGILLEGLRQRAELGVDPYGLGFFAATDTHNATPGLVDEGGYAGHVGSVDDTVTKRFAAGTTTHDTFVNNAGGLTAVWAEENSRDAIYSALRRREVYATSGTRPKVRFFGGWSYPADLAPAAGWEAKAYAGGVPMGSALPARGAAAAPVFLAWAEADAGVAGAPGNGLERLQLIKAWLDASGAPQERVLTLAQAADASPDSARCGPNPKGERGFWKVWTDPDFDPALPAFYYLRVLEAPTCRWSSWDCERAAAAERPAVCDDAARERVVQERAWTSPIWYLPPGS